MLGALQGLSAVGAGLHVGGSVLIVYGQTIVKVGHCIEDSSPIENSWLLPKQCTMPPLWRRPDGRWRRQLAGCKSYAALGWLLFAVGNIMRFVSMRFAAQTVLSGLGSLQFVLIPIASRMLLGIKSHCTTILGVATVLLGNVLIILYGPPEVSFTLRQLRAQWGTTAMEVFLIVLGSLLAGLQCMWWYMTGQVQVGGGSKQQQQQPPQQFLLPGSSSSSPPAAGEAGGGGGGGAWEKAMAVPGGVGGKGGEQDAMQVFMGALLFSAVASFIGAWSVLFSKSLTYVVTALPDSLGDWYSWFVVAAFLGTAAFWVRQSDRGLRLYPASLIMPLMQAFWMCMSVVEGGIYFDELVVLPANSLLLLMLGLMLALVGAVFMGIAGYISERREAALALLGPRMGAAAAGDVESLGLLEAKTGSPPTQEALSWAADLPGSAAVRGEGKLSTPVHRGAPGGGTAGVFSSAAASGGSGRKLGEAELGQLGHLLNPSPPGSPRQEDLLNPLLGLDSMGPGAASGKGTEEVLLSQKGGSLLAEGRREYMLQPAGGGGGRSIFQRVRQAFQ